MRRLQILIDAELDDALALRAHREGTSKAALLREAARERYLPENVVVEHDALWDMVGIDDGPPLAPGETVDDVVYGPRE